MTGSRPPPCIPDNLDGCVVSPGIVNTSGLAGPGQGSDVMQAMAQTKPASSRAMAMTTTCFSLSLTIIRR